MSFDKLELSLQYLLDHFGIWGVGLVIFLESTGLPLPAESLLIAVVLYGAKYHKIDIDLLAFTTIIAAILGDNLGYLLGLRFGSRSVKFLAKKLRIKPVHFFTAQYLFQRFGGIVVILGRFFALMRITSALLAGSLKMSWSRFLSFNVLGALLWGGVYTYGIYYGGKSILAAGHDVFFVLIALFAACLAIIGYLLHRYFHIFSAKALADLSPTTREKAEQGRY